MGSLFLTRLKAEDRQKLIHELHDSQKGNCFICEQSIDLVAQRNSIDIDHVIPLKDSGRDDPANFALTHASCNRSKQAANLEVARILNRFSRLKEAVECENRSPDLGDILAGAGGGGIKLTFRLSKDEIIYSFGEVGDNRLRTVPVVEDPLSGFRYFFALLPIEYLAHDSHINPRSIGTNIAKLVDEFHQGRPQLHVPLAWIRSETSESAVAVSMGNIRQRHKLCSG